MGITFIIRKKITLESYLRFQRGYMPPTSAAWRIPEPYKSSLGGPQRQHNSLLNTKQVVQRMLGTGTSSESGWPAGWINLYLSGANIYGLCLLAQGSGSRSCQGLEPHLHGHYPKRPLNSIEPVIMWSSDAEIKGLRGPRLEAAKPLVLWWTWPRHQIKTLPPQTLT